MEFQSFVIDRLLDIPETFLTASLSIFKKQIYFISETVPLDFTI